MDKNFTTPHGDFEWDADKADINHRKHGVTFEQAAEAFADPYTLVSYDAAHSEAGDRFRLLGMSGTSLVYFVIFVERGAIRIISARKANRTEVRRYDSNRQRH